jgi:hypothetical protein
VGALAIKHSSDFRHEQVMANHLFGAPRPLFDTTVLDMVGVVIAEPHD